jgi:hypothetical protein
MVATLIEALGVLLACVAVGGAAIAIVLMRPGSRRRRRRRRHSAQPKIDLLRPTKPDA